jgi:hypothetical protein
LDVTGVEAVEDQCAGVKLRHLGPLVDLRALLGERS